MAEATGALTENRIADKLITRVSKNSRKNNSVTATNEEKMLREKYVSSELKHYGMA